MHCSPFRPAPAKQRKKVDAPAFSAATEHLPASIKALVSAAADEGFCYQLESINRMSNKREVTERDFRAPEFQDAKVEDYEFRADGKLVRKDRWEMAVHRIRELVGMGSHREFEISEVVNFAESQLRPTPIPLHHWTPDHGIATWWCYSEASGEWLTAAPWIGTPECPEWPGHHTHFTPPPRQPQEP